MRFQSFIAKNIGMPIKSFIKRDDISQILNELNNNQWLSEELLHELQVNRLKDLLCYIWRNIPFYSNVIDSIGADPNVDDPWEIFYRLPLIDKDKYRKIREELMTLNSKTVPSIGYTSGSTGDSFKFFMDKKALKYMYLSGYRGRMWSGIMPGDIEFKIWGNGSYSALKLSRKNIIKYISYWCLGKYVVSPMFNNDEEYWTAVRLLLKVRPKFVFGYANALHSLAKFINHNQIDIGPGWPTIVSYTSEMLFDSQKEDITNAFGCPLMSEYGSAEFGIMAYTCPNGLFHVSDDILIMEIFDGDIKACSGQSGEIVVTNLMAYDFPMIRYRHGDIGVYGSIKCDCGRGLKVLSGLQGRKNDQLKSPSGKIISFLGFAHAIKKQDHIKRFKVVEKEIGDLLLFCEPNEGEEWTKEEQNKFIKKCKALLPDDVSLTIGYIGKLCNDRSGKFKVIVPKNEVNHYIDLIS